jgi:hypothetical protein
VSTCILCFRGLIWVICEDDDDKATILMLSADIKVYNKVNELDNFYSQGWGRGYIKCDINTDTIGFAMDIDHRPPNVFLTTTTSSHALHN